MPYPLEVEHREACKDGQPNTEQISAPTGMLAKISTMQNTMRATTAQKPARATSVRSRRVANPAVPTPPGRWRAR